MKIGNFSLTWRNAGIQSVRYRLLIVIILVVILGGMLVNNFLSLTTLQSTLNRATIIGIIALGITPLLIAGQIDLSIGSILSVSGLTSIMLQPMLGNVAAAIVGILTGTAIGILNATLVVVLKINSLVATLATLLIFASVALLMSGSQPISSEDPLWGMPLTSQFAWIFTPRSLIFILLAIAMFIWLSRTSSGRNMYAIGSNPQASRSSGISPNLYMFIAFIISGTFCGIAGTIQALSNATGSPLAGTTVLIPAITAVVIGGTRLEGGRGSALGTLGGVLALQALTAVFEYKGIPQYIQAIFTGLILIVLITLDRLVTDNYQTTSRTHRGGVRVAEKTPNKTRGENNEP